MRKEFFGKLGRILGPRSTPLIGVDISTSSVKLVELVGSREKPELNRYAIEVLPNDSVVDGNIVKMDSVVAAVERAYRKLGSRCKSAAVALPTSMVITKRIVLPAAPREDDLEPAVESEANQYIPFALDEVNLDYCVVGPAPNDPDQVDVLIAAARKEKIDDRVEAVESVGLNAVVVDVEALAVLGACNFVIDALPGMRSDQNIGVLDIGAISTRFYVFRNGEQIFMRESPFGGNQLSQEIQRSYNMSPEEAEAAKKAGNLPANYVNDVQKPYVDTIAIEVARTLQFFMTSSSRGKIDHLLLAGGGAVIPGLNEAISQRTNVKASLVNPFASMTLGLHINSRQLAQDAPALLVACGLALRRFDQ